MKQGANTCPQCLQDWGDCKCPSWPLRYIRFARPQIFWLLQNGLCWPAGVEGYTDEAQDTKKQNCSAPFESVSIVIAEVEVRVAAIIPAVFPLFAEETPNSQRKRENKSWGIKIRRRVFG